MIRSWDDYVDALGQMPAETQHKNQIKVREMMHTAQQLVRFGVSYPMSEPSCCSGSSQKGDE